MTDQPLNATVIYREDPFEETAIVRVEPDGWDLPVFTPGQFATLGLPDPENPGDKLLKRVYSIASPPGLPYLEFYIRLVKAGNFTQRLWPCEVGDSIFLEPRIVGTFTLDPIPEGSNLILISTGTGLAPYVSMTQHFSGKGRWRHLAVIHGVRVVGELGYRQMLSEMSQADEAMVYLPLVTREPEDSPWTGLRGRVQSLFEEGVFEGHAGFPLDPEQCQVMLCGNPDMIDEMEKQLKPLGFNRHTSSEPGNLHFERYW